MREEQRTAAEFARAHGLNMEPQTRLLDLVSELGELSKEILKASGYGESSVAVTKGMEEETGDCVFSLLCLADSLGLDAEAALFAALEKYRRRFEETGQTGSGT